MWGYGRARNVNTVNLFGDLDEVELVKEVERAFGVSFGGSELESLATVGDMEVLLRNKIAMQGQIDLVWPLLKLIVENYSRPRGRGINRESTFFAVQARKG